MSAFPMVPFWVLLEFVNASSVTSPSGVRLEDIEPWSGKLLTKNEDVPDEFTGTPFQTGDVLFGKLRPYLAKSWLATNEGAATGDIHVYRPRSNVTEPRFLAYIVRTPRFIAYAEGSSEGVKMPRCEWSKLRQFPTPLPDLDTQSRIADYLDKETAQIDTLVKELDEYVELLEKRMQASASDTLFGRSLSRSMKKLHSDIGEVPEAWGISKFSIEMTESQEFNGNNPVGELLSVSEFRGVEPNSRKNGEGQQASEDLSKYRVVRQDQLAANMMWLDHGGIAVSKLEGHISPDYRAFDISERLEPDFVHFLLRSPEYIGYFSTIAVGVRPNAKRTNKTTLGMTPIPVPPRNVQRGIVEKLQRESTKADTLIKECRELKEILLKRRQILITDVVTGKVEV